MFTFILNLFENYGWTYGIIVILILLIFWFLKKEINKIKEEHDTKVSRIYEILTILKQVNKTISLLKENLDKKCDIDHCPQFDKVINSLFTVKDVLNSHILDSQNRINSLTEYSKAKLENLTQDSKETNIQMLALIKTFIDKTINKG